MAEHGDQGAEKRICRQCELESKGDSVRGFSEEMGVAGGLGGLFKEWSVESFIGFVELYHCRR